MEFGPGRVLILPFAELGFAGISVGAAMNGLRPIIRTFNFSLVATLSRLLIPRLKLCPCRIWPIQLTIVFRGGPTGSAGVLSSQHSKLKTGLPTRQVLKLSFLLTLTDAKVCKLLFEGSVIFAHGIERYCAATGRSTGRKDILQNKEKKPTPCRPRGKRCYFSIVR